MYIMSIFDIILLRYILIYMCGILDVFRYLKVAFIRRSNKSIAFEIEFNGITEITEFL